MKTILLLLLLASCTTQLDICGAQPDNECIRSIAIAEGNPELCKQSVDTASTNPLDLPDTIECVYAVVNVTKDPSYCDTLEGTNSYAIPYKDTCRYYAGSM